VSAELAPVPAPPAGNRPGRLVVTRRYVVEFLAVTLVVSATVGVRHGVAVSLVAAPVVATILLVTVLAHEGAHAAAAAALGIEIHTLTLRGALTASIRRDRARGPQMTRSEVIICLAGPAASLVLLVATAIAVVVGIGGFPGMAAWCLLVANAIAVAGTIPGIPATDGTRALQAWRGRPASDARLRRASHLRRRMQR
jgi:hypothetical protein